ncbi:MAG: LysR family transcriptional regulator [Agathobacter sp.]|nr:LysR family transcriptional regulator [Lachnospiraceae bacterium]MDY2620761.1 LysR family transcriptional regulator [Agathobacter sp.]
MLDFRTETFLTVCQTMNFTAAARQLNITQPAVSQHIHFLEEQYHTSLFIYQNKQLFLTRSGEILRRHLLTMKNDEKAVMEELKNNITGIETLSIGVTMTIGEYAIVDKLAGFLIQHPEINIHLHYGNTLQLLKLLNSGQISMAIVEGNYPKEYYSHKKYSTEDYIAVCAASHHFMTDHPYTMNDLVHERLLVREEGSGTRNILEQSLMTHGLHISDFIHYIEIENMHTIIGLLKRDCGISFLYKIAVEKELHSGILKEISLDDFKMQHDFDIIWEKHSVYSDKYLSICEEFI